MADAFDDVFDEDSDVNLGDKEWNRLKSTLTKDGMREGVHQGQEGALQSGFNSGFHQSAALSKRMARLRGFLSALVGYNMTGGSGIVPDSVTEKLKDLLEKVAELEARFSAVKPRQKTAKNSAQENTAKSAESADTTNNSTENTPESNSKEIKQSCSNPDGIPEKSSKLTNADNIPQVPHSEVSSAGNAGEKNTDDSCECGGSSTKCCLENSKIMSNPNSDSEPKNSTDPGDIFRDLPEILSDDYVKEVGDIIRDFDALQEECVEVFKSIGFQY